MTATHHLTAVLAVGVARLVAFKPYSQIIPHTRHPSSLSRIPRPYKTLAWSSVARDGHLAGLSASRAWTRRRVTAAALSRRRCTSRSRTSPSSSTARQSQNCRPAIVTAISSRCQREVGRGRRRRSSRANNGPNITPSTLTKNLPSNRRRDRRKYPPHSSSNRAGRRWTKPSDSAARHVLPALFRQGQPRYLAPQNSDQSF
jgi:hypothetical protein